MLVGETNIAFTLCREVTAWGNKNLELKDDCNTAVEFRKLMYDAYRILRNVGRTWYILHWVAMIKEDYQTADEYAKKSMDLYMRLYATNPTWRHLRLVIETFTEFGDNYEKIGALSSAVFCYETAMNYVRMGENYFQEYPQQISELKETLQRNLEKINDFRF